MSHGVLVAIACISLLNFIAIAALAAASRSRHRFLFRRHLSLQKLVSEQMDEMRRWVRLREIEYNTVQKTGGIPPRFTAQAGEDILIYDFFKQDGPGFFVEAGAYDGITFSNTYLLESLGWRGLLVEPHPGMARQCHKNRPNSIVAQVALGTGGSQGQIKMTCAERPDGSAPLSFVKADAAHIQRCEREGYRLSQVTVPIESLDSLLKGHSETVDFLSLDVEGMEVDVLKGFELERFRPKLLLIERQHDRRDEALASYLAQKGYQAVAQKGCNIFFVPTSLKCRMEALLIEGERKQ
jgi:FkbM family methyltransferase